MYNNRQSFSRTGSASSNSHILRGRHLSFPLIEGTVVWLSLRDIFLVFVEAVVIRLISRFRVNLTWKDFLAEVTLEEIESIVLWTLFFFTAWLHLAGVIAVLLFHLTSSHSGQRCCNLWLEKDCNWFNYWFLRYLIILSLFLIWRWQLVDLIKLDREVVGIAIHKGFII